MESKQQLLPLRVRVNLGVMAKNVYSTLSRFSQFELHYQMQVSVIPKTPFFDESLSS